MLEKNTWKNPGSLDTTGFKADDFFLTFFFFDKSKSSCYTISATGISR